MGIAVLPAQDFLSSHHHRQVVFPANKPGRNPNPNANRSSRSRRNSPPPKAGNKTRSPVQILRPGKQISPETKPKPFLISEGFFAGSSVTAPPPSSVPLPAFFTARKNCAMNQNQYQEIESELKRVLKLC